MKRPREIEYTFNWRGDENYCYWDQYAKELERYIDYLLKPNEKEQGVNDKLDEAIELLNSEIMVCDDSQVLGLTKALNIITEIRIKKQLKTEKP